MLLLQSRRLLEMKAWGISYVGIRGFWTPESDRMVLSLNPSGGRPSEPTDRHENKMILERKT